MPNQQDIATTLLSGFAGALIVQLLTMGWEEWKRRREKRALLEGIISECSYNLNIIDEVLAGALQGLTFKRLSVDYYRSIREMSARYSFSAPLLSALSRIIIDMELFNREADYLFDGKSFLRTYRGEIAGVPASIDERCDIANIKGTISEARNGVVNSLRVLIKTAMAEFCDGGNHDEHI